MKCPQCGESIADDASVCRHCLHVLDREAWGAHDAGRLGANGRGAGRPLEDPPVGPIPVGGSVGGAVGGALRFLGSFRLLGRRRR